MFNTSDSDILRINLQLFADGAGGGAGTGVGGPAAGAEGDGGDGSSTAAVKYGIDFDAPATEEPATVPAEEEESFDSLIKGRYKSDFDSRVQDIVQKRVRNYQQIADSYTKSQPLIDAMAQRYGIEDASNIDAILAAFDEDSQLLEAEADELGIPVAQLKLERENKRLKSQQARSAAEKRQAQFYSMWNQQAEDARQLYPGLDLQVEVQNPRFRALLQADVDVKTAYQVVHQDEILASGMQYATKQAAQKVARSVAAGAKRPSDGGASSAAAIVHKNDVTKLSPNDLKEIYNRVVMRGERISFG